MTYEETAVPKIKSAVLVFLIILVTYSAIGRTTIIKWQMTGKSRNWFTGANIMLCDIYDGATADTDGRFEFCTEETWPHNIQVTVWVTTLWFNKLTSLEVFSNSILCSKKASTNYRWWLFLPTPSKPCHRHCYSLPRICLIDRPVLSVYPV